MDTLGRQLLIELTGCPGHLLDDEKELEALLILAAKQTGAEVLQVHFHEFEPEGISGVVVISESHLTIHTWPEYGYAAVDIFTCGDCVDPWKACEIINARLQAANYTVMEIKRGVGMSWKKNCGEDDTNAKNADFV